MIKGFLWYNHTFHPIWKYFCHIIKSNLFLNIWIISYLTHCKSFIVLKLCLIIFFYWPSYLFQNCSKCIFIGNDTSVKQSWQHLQPMNPLYRSIRSINSEIMETILFGSAHHISILIRSNPLSVCRLSCVLYRNPHFCRCQQFFFTEPFKTPKEWFWTNLVAIAMILPIL